MGIRQVLINLLTNAATYSPAGQTITVELTREGHELRIAVRDGGTGVAPEDAERIFEAWQRADTDTRGLGLGLYLSRRTARAHGGDLRLEPADIEGSIFVLELPVEADA